MFVFRTVFARVFFVFLLAFIIVLGVNSIWLVTSFQDRLGAQQQKDMVSFTENIANGAAYYLDSVGDAASFRRALSENKDLRDLFYSATQRYDSVIWVIDGMGNLIQIDGESAFTGKSGGITGETISGISYRTLCGAITEGKTITLRGTLDGWFASAMLSTAVPIQKGDAVLGAVVTHVSVVSLEASTQAMKATGVRIFGIAVILGAILAFLLSRRFTRPIRALREASVQVAQNIYSDPIPVTTEDEIGELVQAFNDMAAQIRLHEETRQDFVANVSHELRSPITSIQGFTQGMLDGTIPTEEHPRYLAIINEESRRLTRLIKDLLDLSQIESGDFPLRLADFDINKLLRQVLVRYADRGEAKGLEMEVDFRQESCFCRADVDRIEQVLNNLVDNAVKYTPENGRIAIWTHDTGQRTLVSISNTGPGIPSEDLPYVFERFYKTDKSHTDKTGTGLGLAIARKIVTQHGGNLSVRSTPGKETCFLMGLPSGYREPQREPPVDAEYVPANNSTDTSQTKE